MNEYSKKQEIFLKQSIEVGYLGEEFVKFWCTCTNQTYKKELNEDNYKNGIDCYLEGVATDVKNTGKIYLANYVNKFQIRHPFRENSICENYCILDINDARTKFEIVYNGSIKEYIEDLLNPGFSIENLKLILKKYSGKVFQNFECSTETQFLYKIKKDIIEIINPKKVSCNYYETTSNGNGSITLNLK